MNDLDTALVRQAADTSAPPRTRHDAFRQLVLRFQDQAFGYAFALLGDYGLAEDVTQEAFLSAYYHLQQLQNPAAFPGWLKRIVRTQCDRVRRRGQVVTVALEDRHLPPSAPDEPQATLLRNEQTACLQAALNALPAQERMVVVLFYIGGRSRSEVARFLGISPVAVKKRLAAARARLKEQLMDMVEDNLREHRPSRNDTFSTALLGFTRLFSALIYEGASLVRSLDRLAREESDPAFRAVIEDVNREVQEGNSLSGAMARHPRFFSETYTRAIREGEVKGMLEIVLEEIANGTYVPGEIPTYAPDAAAAWRYAYRQSQERGNPFVEPAHVLAGLLSVPEGRAVPWLLARGIALEPLRTETERLVGEIQPVGVGSQGPSPTVRQISRRERAAVKERGLSEIDTCFTLFALLAEENEPAAILLRSQGITAEASHSALLEGNAEGGGSAALRPPQGER